MLHQFGALLPLYCQYLLAGGSPPPPMRGVTLDSTAPPTPAVPRCVLAVETDAAAPGALGCMPGRPHMPLIAAAMFTGRLQGLVRASNVML